jgi:hypothetical protein
VRSWVWFWESLGVAVTFSAALPADWHSVDCWAAKSSCVVPWTTAIDLPHRSALALIFAGLPFCTMIVMPEVK